MSGSRVAPSEGPFQNKNLPLIIAGGVAALLLAGYLGLCAWVMGQDTLLPGTHVAGVNVGGLTPQETQLVLQDYLVAALTENPITLEYQGETHEIAPDWYEIDINFLQLYLSLGRENFLTSGGIYLSRLAGSTSQSDTVVFVTDDGESQLDQLLSGEDWDIALLPTDASYEVVGEELVLTKAVTGQIFDVDTAKSDIKAAVYGTLYQYTGYAYGEDADAESQVILSVIESAGTELDLTAIRNLLAGDTADAYMDENYEIVPHQLGADFDVDEAQSLYDNLSEGDSIAISLSETGDVLTTAEFEALLFADELCTATSYVSGTTDRRTNVKVASGLMDGMILLPGEQFSYQAILQGCDPALGFQTGTGYVNGVSVEVTGGGVCQVTSTLYYGMLTTDLQVDERRAHSYVPGYVPNGMDATYYGGSIDFKFTNNTDYPLMLVTEYTSGNYLTVSIVGTQTQEFTYIPRSYSSDYKTLDPIYVADSTVTQGTIVTEQTAYTGCITSVYREIYDLEGNYIESEYLYTDYYSARSATYHYNPLDVGTMGIPGDPIVTTPTVTEPETTEPETPSVTEPEAPSETETPTVTEPETPAESEATVPSETETETLPQEEESVTIEPEAPSEVPSDVTDEVAG